MTTFTKIRLDKGKVEIQYETPLPGDAVDRHIFTCDEPPTPAFRAALAAFSGFVVQLIDAPAHWHEKIEVRQLSLSEDENGQQGLVVTALKPCKKAMNRTLLVNTPFMAAPPANYNGNGDGFLTDVTIAHIQAAIAEAQKYIDGERGEQTSLDIPESENSKAVKERMAAASAASTRKPSQSKKDKAALKAQADAGVPVVNANHGASLSDETLRQLLLTVDRDVPIDAIAQWLSGEREKAREWAECRQMEMVGTLEARKVPKEPECVIRSATLPLKADEWTAPAPPKVTDDAAKEIAAAAERAG